MNFVMYKFKRDCASTDSGRYSGEDESKLEFQNENVQAFLNKLLEAAKKLVDPTLVYGTLFKLIILSFEQLSFLDYYLDNFKKK